MTLLRSNRRFRFLPAQSIFTALLSLLLLAALPACEQSSPPPPSEPETTDAPTLPEAESDEQTVLFLGNSLSAGLGVDEEESFPALIAQRVDSLGWPVRIVNAGLSGETSAGGLRRIEWLLRQPVDVLVLELGGNDGLRGISPENMRENLQGIIDVTREQYPDVEVVVAGMQVPPNLGPEYTESFQEVFGEIAEANDAVLIPFLLEGVGGVPELNQNDGIHPTAEGHRIIAETVWTYLAPVLEARLAAV